MRKEIKQYRIHGHVRNSDDPDRDSGWLGTIEAGTRDAAIREARRCAPKRYVVDSAERVTPDRPFAPSGMLNRPASPRSTNTV